MIAWHFTDGNKLCDGSPLPPVGEVLRHDGPLVPCKSGLHGCERVLDALQYAPGTFAHRVELGGAMVMHNYDKWCARERTILWSVEADGILEAFARQCALEVVYLPVVAREWLPTGSHAHGGAAWAAERAVAWAATKTGAARAAWASRDAWAARDAIEAAAASAQNARLEAMLTAAHEGQT